MFRKLHIALNFLVVLSLLVPGGVFVPSARAASSGVQGSTGIFRARVVFPNQAGRARLDALGITVLQDWPDGALVLAAGDQLETLARLGFQPRGADDVGTLAESIAEQHPQLAGSITPLLAQASSLWKTVETERFSGAANVPLSPGAQQATAGVHAILASFSPEQLTALGDAISPDSDGDGLTDTEESWWCTDPLNADSDEGGGGTKDGAEVQALKDWMFNKRSGPPIATGKPFSGWPSSIPGCVDDDNDDVPDLAERWVLGLNMNLFSTDRDRYGDGRELYGADHLDNMPAYVKAPGKHPLVAAYPVVEIEMVESSLSIETVTVVTTDHVISEGTEKSYSTAKTEGTSTSESDTETWNDWEEARITEPRLHSLVAVGKFMVGTAKMLYYACKAANLVEKDGCRKAAKAGWEKAKAGASAAYNKSSQFVSDAFTTIKYGTTDLFNKSKDWIDEHLRLNSCSVGLPPSIECEILFRRRAIDDNGLNKEAYSADNADLVGGMRANQLLQNSDLTDIASHYPIYYPNPVSTETRVMGGSRGGAHTTTHTTYEEHTITEGEAFSSQESWGTATAVDSSHAADLWFTYRVRNLGTDYAEQICDLAFNVYLGDDPNPIYTYFVGPDLGGDGCFNNYEPGEEHEFSSRTNTHAIPLTLEMLKAVEADPACVMLRELGIVAPYSEGGRCPGSKIRVVVEDYTYGSAEFDFTDAVNAGVMVAIEDGLDDGDEAIDTFLLPTWGDETVLDVLTRYFPYTTDTDGDLIAIWTPEYNRSDTPAWCIEPRVVGTGSDRTLWCKHALSTADWWNVYTDGMGDGTEGFQDTPASGGSVALFRFNKDTDLDGYSDRSEDRLGTDPEDPADFPRPELLAGIHSITSGNAVTATLSLLNTGLYDAYGIEAVMVAPDDSIAITNNTVGGSGRVRAQRSVVVGSRVALQSPLPSAWLQAGHAKPSASGYYVGAQDRTYTFTVSCGTPGGCEVGAGSWTLLWTDDQGESGTLNFGDGYASPSFLAVGTQGLRLGLLSGTVSNGESFTVEGRRPRDTFQYTINREPHSEPVVIVSYNDPQGNHRFIIPPAAMALSTPEQDLIPFAGKMLMDAGVEIVTTEPFSSSLTSHSLDLVVNNPSATTFTDSHLFLEFINITGTVAAEFPLTTTIYPGPNVVNIDWNTDVFSPTFQADEDYIVMAFWTDYEGNILDTGGRPLSSFQADPRAEFATTESSLVWDFGSAAQGTLLQHRFHLASVGFRDLLTYLGETDGISVEGPASAPLSPADMATYTVTVDTLALPTGAFSAAIPVRTSDPARPTQTLTIQGNITAGTPDSGPGGEVRPLDYAAAISGDHNQGEWVEFTHDLGPDPQTLHPVKVYSQDYATLWGVGKYATDFGNGTASSDMFGDGSDGDLTVSAGQTYYVDEHREVLTASAAAGQNQITIAGAYYFSPGDEVLIIQIQGTGAGNYEFGKVIDKNGNTLTLQNALSNSYTVGGNSKAQVIRVPQYENVTVQNGGILTAHTWDGGTGGIVVFRVRQNLTVESGGTISANGLGYRRGVRGDLNNSGGQGGQGESYNGLGTRSTNRNDGGGGGGQGDDHSRNVGAGGGGGGYGTNGANGQSAGNPVSQGGLGGNAYGIADLSSEIYLGSGGGGGGSDDGSSAYGGYGGNGGGIVLFAASDMNLQGTITAIGDDGMQGEYMARTGGGGGGAGGSIYIQGTVVDVSSNMVVSTGGSGAPGTDRGGSTPKGGDGGDGGVGRIRIEYCDSLIGSTNPAASTQKLDCYIAEQVESSPYTTTRLNLPESFTGGRTYQVQYGRRAVFSGAGEITATLRLSAGLVSTATLDALISGVGSGDVTFRLDIGDDGSWDWETTQNIDGAAALSSPDLAAAFNAWWAANGAPSGGDMDVPVRISLSKAGQVLLTNLVVTGGASTLRAVRLEAQDYAALTIDLALGESGSGDYTLAVDLGDDGSIDWQTSGTGNFPLSLTTGDLASAANAYLAGQSGAVDVPLRFFLAPSLSLDLRGYRAAPAQKPDVAPGALGTAAPAPMLPDSITEGEVVTLTVTLENGTTQDSGPLTAAFFAALPDFGDWYIGSALVDNVPAGGSAQVSLPWDTLGFTGDVPVRVVADPYDRLPESNEDNNENSTTISILTRPDLLPAGIALSDPEPMAGESVTVTLTLSNAGQTAAGASTLALYDGNPEEGGTLLGTATLPVAGTAQTAVAFPWGPSQSGLHRLFVRADQNDVVDEFDENNNLAWEDVHIGLPSPILLDSGGATDPVYTDTLGYGYVDAGQPDVTAACGSEPYQTLRRDPDGQVFYRFDHLLPGHFYHLDITLYECDGAGRQESILVDGNPVAGPEDLSDGRVHQLSVRLDPALYADRSVTVAVEAPGIDGAVVSVVNLYDIDYRYADAGSPPRDPAYPSGTERPYGWLDGVANTTWGVLPYQSVRVNQSGNALRYRFDALDPDKYYQVHLTLWQPSGAARVQNIQIDGADTGQTVDSGDYQIHRLTVDVPANAYADGTITVGVVRTNASTGAFVNEIALEERTLAPDTIPPIADFTATPVSGNAPLTVQFSDRSSGVVTNWAWDFGDGTTSNSPNPAHTYAAAGTYSVSLAVSGPGGSDALTRNDYITVVDLPPDATVMRLAPPVVSVSTGAPVTLTVAISNVTDLGSFQFTLAYSPSLVTVQDVILGDFPGSTGRSFTAIGPAIDNTGGETTFGAFSIGTLPPGASGDGVLAYLVLTPVGAGTASLHLRDVQATDVSGGAITLYTQDGVLNITACLGDFDGDGDIDILDVQRIAYRWNTRSGDALYEPQYDLDQDGDIDILDVQRVAYRWGTQCSPGLAAPQRSDASAGDVSLALTPVQQSVSIGQVFATDVTISDVVDLGAFEFTLAYSPTVVEVVTATLGTFPGSTGRSVVAVQPVIDGDAGTVRFGAFSLGATPPGPSGDGTLARVTFRALAAGSTAVQISEAAVSDRAGNYLPVGDTRDAAVTVRSGWRVFLPLAVR